MMSDVKYFFSENDLLSFVKENAEKSNIDIEVK